MLHTLLFYIYSYILSLHELIKPCDIKILHNDNVYYGLKLYLRYMFLRCIYVLNKLFDSKILLFTKNYVDHDCSHFKSDNKIIRCTSLYDGICIFHQSKNSCESNLFNIHKITKIYLKSNDKNKNILPKLINYVGNNNKFVDVIKIEYMIRNNDVLCIELMINLFDVKIYEVTIDQIDEDYNLENVLEKMAELHQNPNNFYIKTKWIIGDA